MQNTKVNNSVTTLEKNKPNLYLIIMILLVSEYLFVGGSVGASLAVIADLIGLVALTAGISENIKRKQHWFNIRFISFILFVLWIAIKGIANLRN